MKRVSNHRESLFAKRIHREVGSCDSDKDNTPPSLALWQQENVLLMICLYSWLTPLDRLSLRRVSKIFYQDKILCQTPRGVYGPDNVNLSQALQQVQEYYEYCGTPASVCTMHNLPKCWKESGLIDEYGYGHDFDVPNQSLYNTIRGLYNTSNGGSYQLEGLTDRSMRRGLSKVNHFRQTMQLKLAMLRGEAMAYQTNKNTPFNLLFDLLKKHRVHSAPFWKAEYPFELQDIGNNGYQIIPNSDGELEYSEDADFILHLRPGCKVSFTNENGRIESRIIKKCDKCHEIKDTVESERCGKVVGSLRCFHERSVCRSCTTKPTCSTCGRTFCNALANDHGACLNMTKCSVPGCSNWMCGEYCERFHNCQDSEWDDTICGYTLNGKDYCVTHTPEGAAPVHSERLKFRSMLLEHSGT